MAALYISRVALSYTTGWDTIYGVFAFRDLLHGVAAAYGCFTFVHRFGHSTLNARFRAAKR